MQVIQPPGGYGDGPVYVRVHKTLAGPNWPRPGYDIKVGEWRGSRDSEHDYVQAHNSHSAFVYCRWMEMEGIPAKALTVVRV